MGKHGAEPIPGRTPNEPCPTCRQGRLRTVTHKVSGGTDIYGPDGQSWDENIIQHLSCNHCSTRFGTTRNFAGRSVETILERQARRFTNPKVKPTVCVPCEDEKLIQHTNFEPVRVGQPNDFYGTTTTITYCPGCLHVYWIWVVSKHPPAQLFGQEEPDLKGTRG